MTTEATLVSFADVKSMVYDGDVHNEISLINQLSYLGGTTLYMGNKFFGGMIIEWYGNICDFLFLLTILLKSFHHLYLCCPSHDDGPSPSSPSFTKLSDELPAPRCASQTQLLRALHMALVPIPVPAGWSWWSCDWDDGRRFFRKKRRKNTWFVQQLGSSSSLAIHFRNFTQNLRVFQSFGSN